MPETLRASSAVKDIAKAVRVSQPFNCLATSTVKTIFRVSGIRSDFVVKHLHRMGRVRSKLPNGRSLRLWSRADDWISNQVYWKGWSGYEPGTSALFFRFAEKARVTIDVGAHVGFYSLLAAHANPSGRVFAFEPLPEVFARLGGNISLNRLTNIRAVNKAVGDADGTAKFFHVSGGIPSSSSLSYGFMHAWHPDFQSSTVMVTTLDRFVDETGIDHVDLLKIDTESTEPQVLRGAADTLRRFRPTVVCEVLEGYGVAQALEEILRPLDYRFFRLTEEGPTPAESLEDGNYLFTTGTL